MTLLKKFIAILAVSFVGVAGNLNADILDCTVTICQK
jgi:hypothetical protein